MNIIQFIKEKGLGILLCTLIGIGGFLLGKITYMGAVTMSIILGIVVGNLINFGSQWKKGIQFCEKKLLNWAIALMGVKLNFTILKDLGAKAFLLVILGMVFTIGLGFIVAKTKKISPKLAILLGIGNGVCGSSAIGATEGIIGAKEDEVGISITIINFLGVIEMLLLPLLATLILHFSDIKSGLLMGNTLQAVGQVVAAGFSINEEVGQTAVLIKMTRILMLLPLAFILLFMFKETGSSGQGVGSSKRKLPKVPSFIIAFVLLSLIPTFHLLPPKGIGFINQLSEVFLILAMAGIGLKISFKSLKEEGGPALLAGSLIAFCQVLFTLLLISFLY